MRIDELVDPNKFSAEEYDLQDDLKFFMNNDPEFYRKHYYPNVIKMKICRERGDEFNSDKFQDLVKEAYKVYKEKFAVKDLKSSLDDEQLSEICSKIYEDEMNNIKSGHYD
jgi:hypothetical protein